MEANGQLDRRRHICIIIIFGASLNSHFQKIDIAGAALSSNLCRHCIQATPALRGPEALPPLVAAPTEKRYVVIKRNPIADRSLR